MKHKINSPIIQVFNNDIDNAINKFMRELKRSGEDRIRRLKEMGFEKPSQRRKRKKRISEIRKIKIEQEKEERLKRYG